MATQVATGHSRNESTRPAVRECIEMARSALSRPAAFGFLFASSRHDLAAALHEAESLTGASILAASTAGEFTANQFHSGGVVVMLVASDTMISRAELVRNVRGAVDESAKRLAAPFAELVQEGRRRTYSASTTVVLVDGLSGEGEALVEALRRNTRPFQQVVGGAAGDDAQFRETVVGARGAVSAKGAVALHVVGERAWGVGLGTGLSPATPRMMATRSRGNELREIDGRPAFEVYRDYAKKLGVDLTPEGAGPFMIQHEIGVFFLDELRYARAALKVNADGSLLCAAAVAEGASLCFLTAEPDAMVAATRSAAIEARNNLGGAAAAGVLVFDCVCRASILGGRFDAELSAVRSVFGNVPVAGFMTYGEIARYKGILQGWHNTTAVVVAIPA